jgi:regulator of replication initiation timing
MSSPGDDQASKSFEDPSMDTPSDPQINRPQAVSIREFQHEMERQRDIYEEEIIALHEELEHLKHVGGRIIEERVAGYKHENAQLRALLKEKGVELPSADKSSEPGSNEKLTKSERAQLQEYLAQKEKAMQAQQF